MSAPDRMWQPIETAPRDGTRVKLRVVYELEAEWRGGLLNDQGQDCGGWHAVCGDIPPCWTDDVCWESNEDGNPSAQPDGWQSLPTPPALKEPSEAALAAKLTEAQRDKIVELGGAGLPYGGLFHTGLGVEGDLRLKRLGLVGWHIPSGAMGALCSLTPLGRAVRAHLETPK